MNQGHPFPPRGGQPLPGMTQLPAPPPGASPNDQQQGFNNIPGNTDTVIYKPEGRGASHIAGLAAAAAQARNPPPQPEEEDYLPPPPPVRPNGGSADVSLNDSASTTQSNVTSECSEAECDREPLVKPGNRGNWNFLSLFQNFSIFSLLASMGSPRDMTTEEMRKLLERNEVVQGNGGGNGLQPFDTVNV